MKRSLAPSEPSSAHSAVSRPARILLVEDDATTSELLAYNLRRAGYDVIQASDGRNGLEIALRESVQLVLMDVLLPGLDGMTASREILRVKPQLPVIMVSAVNDREHLLQGFTLGADDYVTKPFDLDLLLARIAASLRRSAGGLATTAQTWLTCPVAVEGLVLDSDSRSLRNLGKEVALTSKEFDLLRLLMSRPGRLFSKEEITEAVWHHRYLSTSRTLDAHMRRLRRKLQLVEAAMTVQVVRRVGYRLAPKPKQGC